MTTNALKAIDSGLSGAVLIGPSLTTTHYRLQANIGD